MLSGSPLHGSTLWSELSLCHASSSSSSSLTDIGQASSLCSRSSSSRSSSACRTTESATIGGTRHSQPPHPAPLCPSFIPYTCVYARVRGALARADVPHSPACPTMQPQLTSSDRHFVILSQSTHANTESLQRLIHMPSFSPPYLPPQHFSLCRICYGGTRPAWHHLLDARVLTSLPK